MTIRNQITFDHVNIRPQNNGNINRIMLSTSFNYKLSERITVILHLFYSPSQMRKTWKSHVDFTVTNPEITLKTIKRNRIEWKLSRVIWAYEFNFKSIQVKSTNNNLSKHLIQVIHSQNYTVTPICFIFYSMKQECFIFYSMS